MKFSGSAGEFIDLQLINTANCSIFRDPEPSSLTVLWFQEDNNRLIVDGREHCFQKNQIVFFTEFHQIEVIEKHATRYLRFNRPFYCIIDNDEEVSCRGLLFFGASQLPIIDIPEEHQDHFDTLWKMFNIEMQLKDNLQISMLQMMLKRYLILCTRLYKEQSDTELPKSDMDLVRSFNFLVEKHFKTLHSVSDYAELLNKSPKTIANVFAQKNSKTPLQYIQDRIMLASRRLLIYNSMSIKEVAYEVGFEDIQSFSRFFKKQEGESPSTFRKSYQTGQIANT